MREGSVLPPLRWLAVELLPVGHIGLKDGVARFTCLCARDGIASLRLMQGIKVTLPGTGSVVCDGRVLSPMAHHLRSDTALRRQLAGFLVFRDML